MGRHPTQSGEGGFTAKIYTKGGNIRWSKRSRGRWGRASLRWETSGPEANGAMQKIGQLRVGCWGNLGEAKFATSVVEGDHVV